MAEVSDALTEIALEVNGERPASQPEPARPHSYASIEVHAAAPNGAAMAILEVEGGLQNEELVDGAHFQFQNYEYSDTGLYMYVIGCSGPSEGSWYFDEQAQDTTVDVTVTAEGTMVVDFASTFSDGQTVVGSTELGPLQAQ